MGLLSIFGKKNPEDVARKHAGRVGDKRGYAPDRWDSIRALTELAHPAAAQVLLQRFTFKIEPSITDQEEKDLAFRGIVAAGEGAVPHIVAFLATAESATWPVKMLTALLPEDRVVDEIVTVLDGMTPNYAKDPQRKIQLLMELESRRHERATPAALRFFEDPNESVRFHAVQGAGAQTSIAGAREALHALYESEESARVRSVILDAFIAHAEAFPADTAHLARAKAPNGYSIANDGRVSRV
jgi:hypothetical protein